MSTPKKVFISHIHEEAALGAVVKHWVTDAFGAVHLDAFLSSDHRDIPAGRRWLDEVERELAQTGVMISLVSPASLARPWVNIELGAAWIKGITVIPFCHSGLTIANLPRPFGDFNGVDLAKDNAPRILMGGVADALKIVHPEGLSWAEILKQMRDAAPKVGSSASSNSVAVPSAPVALVRKEQVEILRVLVRNKDLHRAELPANELMVYCGLAPSAFNFHTKQLLVDGLIDVTVWDDVSHYRILDEGIEYLGRKNLL